jgi:ERF superfamily
VNDFVNQETGEILPPSSNREWPNDNGISQNTTSHLDDALLKITLKLPVWITKDQEGPHKSMYATHKAILSVVRPIALEHGVLIRQGADHAWQLDTPQGKGRMVPIFTELCHVQSGEKQKTIHEIPLMKFDAMAMGSAITFGKRYTLLSAFGLATDESDDDGAATAKKGITDELDESQELWAIKEQIKACKDHKQLSELGKEYEQKGTVEKLSPNEIAIARLYYSERLRALRYAPVEKPQKEKT